MLEVSCNMGGKEKDTYFEVTEGRDDLSLFDEKKDKELFAESSGDVVKSATENDRWRPTEQAMKNIRQIGMISSGIKIYIEDQVIRFIEKNECCRLRPVALLGQWEVENGSRYFYVTGGVCAEGMRIHGNRVEFMAEAFQNIEEEKEIFFPGTNIVGWFLPNEELLYQYGTVLGERGELLCAPDEEEELKCHLLQNGQIIGQDGYYIFYEKNEAMRQYRIAHQEQWREAAEEQKEEKKEKGKADPSDREEEGMEKSIKKEGVKKLARKAKEKKTDSFVDDYQSDEQEETAKLTTFLYAASTVLAIVVLVIGITLVNNYEKMYELQDSVNTIAQALRQPSEENEGQDSVAADGAITELPEAQKEDEQSEEAAETVQVAITATPEVTKIPETTETEGRSYYTIQPGDTLVSISRKIYNDDHHIDEICDANGITREQELIVGKTLLLP